MSGRTLSLTPELARELMTRTLVFRREARATLAPQRLEPAELISRADHIALHRLLGLISAHLPEDECRRFDAESNAIDDGVLAHVP